MAYFLKAAASLEIAHTWKVVAPLKSSCTVVAY